MIFRCLSGLKQFCRGDYLVADTCTVHVLASPAQDALASLLKLVDKLGASDTAPVLQPLLRPGRPRGKLTAEKVCKAIGHLLPERAIIVDEAQTSGVFLPILTAGSPRHDVITLTGGAIGQALPNAIGAAIAYPDRQVLALSGDGSAMYTIQALWTMAREKLNVISIIFNNRSYAILNLELQRVGASEAGPKAKAQLDLNAPAINFAQLGQSMGVRSVRTTTTEDFVQALEHSLAVPGPHLIEVLVPSAISGFKLKMLPRLLRAFSKLPQPLARAIKRKVSP